MTEALKVICSFTVGYMYVLNRIYFKMLKYLLSSFFSGKRFLETIAHVTLRQSPSLIWRRGYTTRHAWFTCRSFLLNCSILFSGNKTFMWLISVLVSSEMWLPDWLIRNILFISPLISEGFINNIQIRWATKLWQKYYIVIETSQSRCQQNQWRRSFTHTFYTIKCKTISQNYLRFNPMNYPNPLKIYKGSQYFWSCGCFLTFQ